MRRQEPGVPRPPAQGLQAEGRAGPSLILSVAVSERGAQSANPEGDLEDPGCDGRAEEE